MMDGLRYYFIQLPVRLIRIVKHFIYPLYRKKPNDFPPKGFMEWVADTFFYLLDILAIPELYQGAARVFKWNIRRLKLDEINLGKSVFGTSIDYNLVRIDDRTRLGTKRMALAYVSFNIINYRSVIKDEILVHELMHIWQFQHFGSIYIARAIKAQRSKEGYDYGGVANLYQLMVRQAKILDFNFEQQADIIEDYFIKVVSKNLVSSAMDVQIYTYFANQLKRHC
jgi:hypothetical protein